MMSRIEQLISEIEEYIDTCKYQALSNTKIIVNKEELEELLVELRLRIPDEIKKYQKIISQQDTILGEAQAQADAMMEEAKKQADSLVARADEQTSEMVNEHEIMQRAYAHANEVVEQANMQAQAIVDQALNDANTIRQGSIQYTDDMLRSLQTIINHTMEGQRAFRRIHELHAVQLRHRFHQPQRAVRRPGSAGGAGGAGASCGGRPPALECCQPQMRSRLCSPSNSIQVMRLWSAFHSI